MRRRTTQRGFTLVELMVVVAIIGVLSGLLISASTSPQGANPQNLSQQIAGFYNTCRMRAVSTRRWHRCEVSAQGILMEQWSATGMTQPSGTCTPPSTNCWQMIQSMTFDKNLWAWAGSTTVQINTGASFVRNANLPFAIDFRPDGSSTGGTVFLSDNRGNHPWRAIVYRVTGASYARIGW